MKSFVKMGLVGLVLVGGALTAVAAPEIIANAAQWVLDVGEVIAHGPIVDNGG